MMRVGFLPGDFDPMVLMLGEADDCRTLATVLRQFALDGADVSISALGFCGIMYQPPPHEGGDSRRLPHMRREVIV